MNLRIIITPINANTYGIVTDIFGCIRIRHLHTYLSIPTVTFQYGQTPSDTQCYGLFIVKVQSH